MSTLQDVYIAQAVRTPVGKIRGVFNHVRPDDLLVHALKGLMAQVPDVPSEKIEDVIIGCAMPEGEQGMNVARISTLLAGLSQKVPAMTVNRFCASGLQAIAQAADRIATGQSQAIIAGGVESMTRIPMGGYNFRANPAYFSEAESNVGIAYGMGITAEIVAEKWQVTREEQDEFACESHRRAIAAISSQHFTQEIVPVSVKASLLNPDTNQIEVQESLVEHDQGPRKDTNLETLAKLRTAFLAKGTITAGNASQMSDGAAALLVASEQFINQHDLTPLAKFKAYSVAGIAPEIMGVGPIEAIPQALKAANLKQDDLDWIELNEAFAAQSLAVIKELDLNKEKVNPQGGAIALGHPLGATGAIRAATLLHGLRRTKGRYGMVTMCIGTGMGAAGIFEMV